MSPRDAGRILRSFLFAAGAALAAPGAGQAASAVAEAQAILIAPTALSETARLDFGTIILSGEPGAVSLAPDGTVTTRGVNVGDSKGVSTGSFRMYGGENQTYTISLPNAITFRGGQVLRISSFTHDAGSTPVLGGNGSGGFNIGATLLLGVGRPTGYFDGNLVVVISNN